MSRLSRFKKNPPPKISLPQPQHSKPTYSSMDIDSDSDDDFTPVSRKVTVKKPINQKKEGNVSVKETNPKGKLVLSSTSGKLVSEHSIVDCEPEPSFSAYFPPKEEKNIDVVPERVVKNVKSDTKSVKVEHDLEQQPEPDNYKIEAIPNPIPSCKDPEMMEIDVKEEQCKTKCPFCNKGLADKLTGTTHIKSCAKDLPTEQVIKAMELYEKQIQEWKQLGLPCPGFSSNNVNNRPNTRAKKTTSTNGGGRRRKKNNAEDEGGADAELELALALSISLHEEVESKLKKDKEMLALDFVAAPLTKSDPAPKVFPTSSSSSTKSAQIDTTKELMKSAAKLEPKRSKPLTLPVSKPGVKRRGKKIQVQLSTLPLFTVSEEEKKTIVEKKVANILEQQGERKDERFYVRDEGLVEKLGVPKRLVQYQNKECSLWSLAQGGMNVPDESFSVLDYAEPSIPELSYSINRSDIPPVTTSVTEPDEDLPSKNPPEKHAAKSTASYSDHDHEQETKISKELKKSSSSCSKKSKSYITPDVLEKLPVVVRDLAKMLQERKDCDIILYGREEKRIPCHRLILTARCPKLLKGVIEESRKGSKRFLLPLTEYSHDCVLAFVWYLYTSRIFPTNPDPKILEELTSLGDAYGVKVEELELEQDHITTSKVTSASTSDVSIQAQVDVSDCSMMTEPCGLKEENTLSNSRSKDELNKSTQELFSTFLEGDSISSSPVAAGPVCVGEENVSISEPVSESRPNDNVWWGQDDDAHSSCDLFEEYDNDIEPNPGEDKDEGEQSCTSTTINPDPDQFLQSDEEDEKKQMPKPLYLLEDDALNQELILSFNGNNNDGIDLDDIGSPEVSQREFVSSSSERKRSRSVSPYYASGSRPSGLFSATQAAYLATNSEDKRDSDICVGEGTFDEDDSIFQANKKQKLELNKKSKNIDSGFSPGAKGSDEFTSDEICGDGGVEMGGHDSDYVQNELDFLNDNEIVFDKFESDFNCTLEGNSKSDELLLNCKTPKTKRTPQSRTPSRLTFRKRSGSTPNLSRDFGTVNFSFHSHQQRVKTPPMVNGKIVSGDLYSDHCDMVDQEPDPFELDGNDSLFANLKTPTFLPESTYRGKLNLVTLDDTPISRDSRISLGLGKLPSRKNLSLVPEEHSGYNLEGTLQTSQKQGKKAKGKQKEKEKVEKEKQSKSKTKAAPKLTLPARVPSTSVPSSAILQTVQSNNNRSTCSQPKPQSKSQTRAAAATTKKGKNTDGSPMLNYSLIDTPILKQELKKYGLKPLPRSKAKVLLRHIYHETHK